MLRPLLEALVLTTKHLVQHHLSLNRTYVCCCCCCCRRDPSDLGLGLLITEDDAKAVKPNMIQQTFFEFDLESFSSCEMSRRLPQIHFGDAFVDIESKSSGKLYDVVQMQIVNMEGLQQDTVVFREREESDPVELQSSTARGSEDP